MLLVVIFHATPVYMPELQSRLLSALAHSGFAGVDIFFVISGYIIWHTSEKLDQHDGARAFITRRLKRIFSGYWPFFVLALLVALIFAPQKIDKINLIGSALLLPIPISERILPVSWSLTYELYFYLMFAFVLLFKTSMRQLILAALVVLIVLVNMVGVIVFQFYTPDFFSKVPLVFRIPFSPYNLEFITGALICANYRKLKLNHPLFCLLFSSLLYLMGAIYNTEVAQSAMGSGFYVIERVGLFGASSVFLLLFMLSLERKGVRILPRMSLLLGGASYSTYLSHTLIILISVKAFQASNIPGVVQFVLVVGVIFLYSALHYMWIEKPLYRWLRRAAS